MQSNVTARIRPRYWLLVALVGCWAVLPNATAEILVPPLDTPAPLGSHQHGLNKTTDGRLLLSWVETQETTSRVRFSIRAKGAWSTPITVATVQDELRAAPVVLGLSDGTLAAAWMTHHAQSGNKYAAEIYLSRSTDGGEHWSEPLRPYSAKARVYDAQMSLAPLDDGRLALVWTDQRFEHRYQTRGTVVDWSGTPGAEIVLDSDNCSCCESDTVAQGNDLWTVYRDRLEGEVRDIGLAHWTPDGNPVSGRVHDDHWVIKGCPSNGPAIGHRDELTVVAWFTAAANSPGMQAKSAGPPSWKEWMAESEGTGRVLTAFSRAGVGHFGEPITVDDDANGYVKTLLLEDGSALVAWRDRAGPVEKLQLAQVRQDGTVRGPITVYQGGFPSWPSRHLGLTVVGNSVFVAWTAPDPMQVRLVQLPLTSITGAPGTVAQAD